MSHMKHIDIVFDGPPGPEAGRFVEVEDQDGASIGAGEWVQDGDLWRLRLPDHRALREQLAAAEAERDRLIGVVCDNSMEEVRRRAALRARVAALEEAVTSYRDLVNIPRNIRVGELEARARLFRLVEEPNVDR